MHFFTSVQAHFMLSQLSTLVITSMCEIYPNLSAHQNPRAKFISGKSCFLAKGLRDDSSNREIIEAAASQGNAIRACVIVSQLDPHIVVVTTNLGSNISHTYGIIFLLLFKIICAIEILTFLHIYLVKIYRIMCFLSGTTTIC